MKTSVEAAAISTRSVPLPSAFRKFDHVSPASEIVSDSATSLSGTAESELALDAGSSLTSKIFRQIQTHTHAISMVPSVMNAVSLVANMSDTQAAASTK